MASIAPLSLETYPWRWKKANLCPLWARRVRGNRPFCTFWGCWMNRLRASITFSTNPFTRFLSVKERIYIGNISASSSRLIIWLMIWPFTKTWKHPFSTKKLKGQSAKAWSQKCSTGLIWWLKRIYFPANFPADNNNLLAWRGLWLCNQSSFWRTSQREIYTPAKARSWWTGSDG